VDDIKRHGKSDEEDRPSLHNKEAIEEFHTVESRLDNDEAIEEAQKHGNLRWGRNLTTRRDATEDPRTTQMTTWVDIV
jgi:hypothetical protein